MKTICLLFTAVACSGATVSATRVPNGGIQPQVVEKDGVVHLLYYTGAPDKGDLFYVRSADFGATFSKPVPVSHTPGSAIAMGNIRGAQLAVGKGGRVHVAWNGTAPGNTPMLYTRLNDAGTAFEPEKNVIKAAYGLDGGGSLAADSQGNVYVFWHAPMPGTKGEQNRRVWVARSTDEGATFQPERIAFGKPVGACGCCGMKAQADDEGNLHVLFRSADQLVNRDIWLLTSTDHGRTFTGTDVSHWNIGACVMSSAFFAPSPGGLLAAWEAGKQAWFGQVVNGKVESPVAAPGTPVNRKYPVLARNQQGEVLFAWTEGMAWKKTGAAMWRVYEKDGRPEGPAAGAPDRVPVWSLIAAFARPDGNFVVLY